MSAEEREKGKTREGTKGERREERIERERRNRQRERERVVKAATLRQQ